MSMHMEGPYLTTTGKRKGKAKFRNAEAANKARRNAESWQQLLDKYEVKTEVRKPAKRGPTIDYTAILRGKRSTNHIPSVDTGVGIAAKPQDKVYTGDAIIGIGQLHKSNGIPVFSRQDAHDLAIMRRG